MVEVSVSPSETQGEPVKVGETPAAAQRPDNVPEKFWNAETGQVNTEALLSSYAEAEGKLRSGVHKAEPQADASADELSIPKPPKLNVEEVLNTVAENYKKAGSFSEDDLKKIAETGVTKGMVENHIRGQQADASSRVEAAYKSAGGKDQYSLVTAWAGANLSEAEVAAFDKIVSSGEAIAIDFAVSGLKAKYVASEGSEGLRVGGAKPSTQSDVFETRAEFVQITRDPKYTNDAKYRSEVDAKVARSMKTWK